MTRSTYSRGADRFAALEDHNWHAGRRARQPALQPGGLENRTLLAYTFALVGQAATVTPVAATGGPMLIDEVLITGNPFLEWSQDNGFTFSADWDDRRPQATRPCPRPRRQPSTSRRPPARVRRSHLATW